LSDGKERREDAARPREDVSRPPGRPPGPQDIHFHPVATGFAVFTAVAIPVVVFGYTRSPGPNDVIIGIGVAVGLLAGLIAGLWVDSRGGRVWRGPQL
jgi:hypothetical protein